MSQFKVAVKRYEKPLESVRKTVDACSGLDRMPSSAKVFIKPNVVFWTKAVEFPKWGVITTSRVVEDIVVLLKERGVDDITIGEGTVVANPKDTETQAHAYESLGYNLLKDRYGIKVVNVFERPFEKVDLGDGIELKFNTDILHSDFVVNLPVLKTHAQCIVSLGIKNIKGTININSRKKCHVMEEDKDLHSMVSRLADKIPPSLTLIDGIYTIERGPGMDGKARRSNILVGSGDVLSADFVGTKLLGYEPGQIPHLVHAARNRSRPLDLSDIEVVGEKIEDLASLHPYEFPYSEDRTRPVAWEKKGIYGVDYPKYDLTMCTYCSGITGAILMSIAFAWKGEPFDDVEVLTGKIMKPTPGKKSILIGKCLYEANKNHPDIDKMVTIKSCPPSPQAIIDGLQKCGIDVNPSLLLNMDKAPAAFMAKYESKPEFEKNFFEIK